MLVINPKNILVIGGLTLFGWAMIAAIALLFMGCGGEYNLQEGTYNVTATVNITTDPFVAGEYGGSFEAEWDIEHKKEGRYLLTMSTTEMYGADAHGISMFSLEEKQGSDECPFYTTLVANLTPTNSGFVGTAYMGYTFCTQHNPNTNETLYADWNTEYSVTGVLK